MSSISAVRNVISRVSGATTGKIVSVAPKMTVSNEKLLKGISWIGEKVSSPQNRLILGITALMFQPFIDLSNKKVDEDTRKISAARTVAKIIAGTLTGVAIRSGCIHAIDAFTKRADEITPNMKFKNLRTLFMPDVVLENLNQYKKSLGTIMSLGIMVFTNFLIDAPLTKFLTNKFIDRIHKKDELGVNNRTNDRVNNVQSEGNVKNASTVTNNTNKEVKHE